VHALKNLLLQMNAGPQLLLLIDRGSVGSVLSTGCREWSGSSGFQNSSICLLLLLLVLKALVVEFEEMFLKQAGVSIAANKQLIVLAASARFRPR
jgi:hypothetical protein